MVFWRSSFQARRRRCRTRETMSSQSRSPLFYASNDSYSNLLCSRKMARRPPLVRHSYSGNLFVVDC